MKQHKSLLSIKKVPSERNLTLTFFHKFKSEQYFGRIIKKKLVLGLFFPILYIISIGLCVSK